MGKKSGGGGPAAPDPVALANAQAEANKKAAVESASLNAVDMFGPYGSVTYQRRPDGSPTSQTTTLNPTDQQTLDKQRAIALQLTGQAQGSLDNLPTTPFSLAGNPYDPRGYNTGDYKSFNPAPLPYDPRGYGDSAQYDQQTADTVFNEGMRKMQPVFSQQRDRLMQTLEDRGIAMNSPAWTNAVAALDANQNDAMTGLSNQSFLTGHDVAGDRIAREQGLRTGAYNEDLTTNKQQNADWLQRMQTEQNLRGQTINEDSLVRNAAFNEASMYLQGAPAMNTPNQVAVGQYAVDAPDVISANQLSLNQQNANATAANQKRSSIWNGVGQAAQAGMGLWMMSSAVYKDRVGGPDSFLSRARELTLVHWKYKHQIQSMGGDSEDHFGPMAEQWAHLFGGPSEKINVATAVFVLWRAVQELASEVDRLKGAAA